MHFHLCLIDFIHIVIANLCTTRRACDDYHIVAAEHAHKAQERIGAANTLNNAGRHCALLGVGRCKKTSLLSQKLKHVNRVRLEALTATDSLHPSSTFARHRQRSIAALVRHDLS